MKLSTLILGAMSVAVLSACQDKKKTEVQPAGTEQVTPATGHQTPQPPNDCPACGMG